MNNRQLLQLFDPEVDARQVLQPLAEELKSYIYHSLHKQTVPVYVDDDITRLDKEQIISLLRKYLDGHIGEWDLEYIFSVLDLAEPETDSRTEKVVFLFSGPYIGTYISPKNVKIAIDYLKGITPTLEPDYLPRKKPDARALRPNYRSVVMK